MDQVLLTSFTLTQRRDLAERAALTGCISYMRLYVQTVMRCSSERVDLGNQGVDTVCENRATPERQRQAPNFQRTEANDAVTCYGDNLSRDYQIWL